MQCPNCHAEISEQAEICPKCGVRIKQAPGVGVDQPNWGINIISLCCIPILGIIMYFVWKNEKPAAAKSALTFSLIGIGVVVVIYILAFALGLVSSLADV